MNLVSVVIVNWNGQEVITDCLESVYALNYRPIEVIVVDNGSVDDSINVIDQVSCRKAKVIALKENVGFAAGMNIGFKKAHGEFIATLNNDMVVKPTWLDQPLEILAKDETVGVVSCRQMNYYDRSMIDGLYHTITRELVFMPFGFGKKIGANGRFLEPGFVISANGGSAIIRAETLREVGAYDSDFFGYMEETDFCMRAFLKGWRCAYAPDAVVYHKEGFSFKKTGGFRYYLRERNRIWFLYKNIPLKLLLRYSIFLIIMELRVIRVFCFKLKKPALYFRARRDAFSVVGKYKKIRKENLVLFNKREKEFFQFFKKKVLEFPSDSKQSTP